MRPEAINLDMEFAEEGGEGATPYEVLLHAAMIGQSTRFTRQDGVEETWRIMQPLLDAPPPVHSYRRDRGGRPRPTTSSPATVAGTRRGWCRELLGAAPAPREQSAAMPSPFPRSSTTRSCPTATPARWSPPTGASGGCACPASTRPSVFATLLDREAGYFRMGPFGINVPTARAYEPGTNILSTTWHTKGGWVVVRDALTMGPH